MLPRIKQIQAGDRFFLAQKWPTEAGFIQSLTGQEATWLGGFHIGRSWSRKGAVCMGFTPFYAREAPTLTAADI